MCFRACSVSATTNRVTIRCAARSARGSVGGDARRASASLAVVLGWLGGLSASLQAEVGFNREVRPILSEHCFTCHGPDAKQRKGKLRLDVREEALQPAASGKAAIVPGQPKQSALMQRIRTTAPDEVMPPPDAHRQLTSAQKQVLERWVAEGAK